MDCRFDAEVRLHSVTLCPENVHGVHCVVDQRQLLTEYVKFDRLRFRRVHATQIDDKVSSNEYKHIVVTAERQHLMRSFKINEFDNSIARHMVVVWAPLVTKTTVVQRKEITRIKRV